MPASTSFCRASDMPETNSASLARAGLPRAAAAPRPRPPRAAAFGGTTSAVFLDGARVDLFLVTSPPTMLSQYPTALPTPDPSAPVWKANLQPDFNVRVCDGFDTSASAVLRELDESNRFVQKSAESTSI